MAERLREVAEHLACLGVDLLSEQADVVGVGKRLFEGRAGAVQLSGHRLSLG